MVVLSTTGIVACERDTAPTAPKNMKPPDLRGNLVYLGNDVFTNSSGDTIMTQWDDQVCESLADGCDYFDEDDIDMALAIAYNLIYGNEWMGDCMMVGTSMMTQIVNHRLRWGNRRPGSGGGQSAVNYYGVFEGRDFDAIEDQITIFDPALKSGMWEARSIFVHEMAHAAGANSYDLNPTIRQTAYTSTYQPMAIWLENECVY